MKISLLYDDRICSGTYAMVKDKLISGKECIEVVEMKLLYTIPKGKVLIT